MEPVKWSVYLSKEGDSIEIVGDHIADMTPILREQWAASSCKTHAQVLAFLERMAHSESTNAFTFYHEHNPSYTDHCGTWPKGGVHLCPIDQQISFVRYKLSESKREVRTVLPLSMSFCVIS